MKNYYRYLPVSTEDEKWGLCVLSAGSGRIKKSETYPDKGHPGHHYFNWKNGRVLNEYQVIYITKGKGVFESASCPRTIIREGTIILLFPGEWHRYKPDEDTGWNEHWVGFRGQVADNLVKEKLFHPAKSFLVVGYNESFIRIFDEIIENAKEEKAGYQAFVSGAVLYLLGKIYAFSRQQFFETQDQVEWIVSKAKVLLREYVDKNIAVEEIAQELQVGYSWFRKAFKSYTGMAPGQYLIQLKIERSKELLLDKNRSIKEVAYDLNFDSSFYFSRLFKDKTGLTPDQFRKGNFDK